MINLKRWFVEIVILSLVFAGVGYAAHEQYFPNGIKFSGAIIADDAAGPTIVDETATSTNPTLIPNKAETDTGIGWASDTLHIVLGGADEYSFSISEAIFKAILTVKPDGTNEVLQVNDGSVDFTDGNAGTTGTLTVASDGDIDYNKNIYANDAAGPAFLNEAATTTNPTLCPDKAEEDTGIGWASDTIHIVLGGVDEYRFSASGFALGLDDAGNTLTVHSAGTIVMNDDSDDTTVTFGPVTDGTTVLPITGSITASNLAQYGTIYIDAGAMVPCTTNPAEAGTNEYGTNDIDMDYMAFDPGATEERIQFKLVMPENWDRSDATMKAKFYWSDDTTGSAAETVEWGIKAGAYANDVAIDTALGTAVTISDTVIASSDMHITSATAVIVVAQAQALGDMIVFEVFRNTDGTDDMDDDAWLLGVLLQYKKDNTVSAW